MKKLLFLTVFLCAISINSQSLGYNDIGVLLTEDFNYGTARFRAMGGAFGALGGDLSSLSINPAGAAVFLKSEFSASYNYRETSINSNYYGENSLINTDNNRLSQMGGVFVFRTGNSNWNKTAIGFNYNVSNDFNDFWIAQGNSNNPTFIEDEFGDLYLFSNGQYFDNYTSGRNDKYTFSFASQYNDKIYVGASFTTNDVNFYQQVYLEEDNHDNMGNSLVGSLEEELLTYGTGFSFNVGIIARPTNNIRLGIAYQSPIWYELNEEFSSTEDGNGINGFNYSMKSPGRATGSLALLLGKLGLVSIDYVYKDYSNISLSPDYDFIDENKAFNTNYRSTSEVRIGSELRISLLSVRAGYNIQQSPYVDAPESYNLEGYSVGAGLNFGAFKFDVSYEKTQQSSSYDFYPQYNDIDPAYLQKDNSLLTATLTFSL